VGRFEKDLGEVLYELEEIRFDLVIFVSRYNAKLGLGLGVCGMLNK